MECEELFNIHLDINLETALLALLLFCGNQLRQCIKNTPFISLVKSGDKGLFGPAGPRGWLLPHAGGAVRPHSASGYEQVRRTHLLSGSSLQETLVLESSGHGQCLNVCQGMEGLLSKGESSSVTEICRNVR